MKLFNLFCDCHFAKIIAWRVQNVAFHLQPLTSVEHTFRNWDVGMYKDKDRLYWLDQWPGNCGSIEMILISTNHHQNLISTSKEEPLDLMLWHLMNNVYYRSKQVLPVKYSPLKLDWTKHLVHTIEDPSNRYTLSSSKVIYVRVLFNERLDTETVPNQFQVPLFTWKSP
jgi:hypothetical protein